MPVVYTAVRRFDPSSDGWQKFIAWSGLTQFREVISLDGILCPSIFQDLTAEDWQHNVQEDFMTHLIRDLDYMVCKVGDDQQVNVLALLQNPTVEEFQSFSDPRFVLRGIDLVDVHGDISALVNCGGFPKAFQPFDLSGW